MEQTVVVEKESLWGHIKRSASENKNKVKHVVIGVVVGAGIGVAAVLVAKAAELSGETVALVSGDAGNAIQEAIESVTDQAAG
jgi:hypothetical protein